MASAKVYVAVLAAFSADGILIPRKLKWEDGQQYIIDRVIDVRPAAAIRLESFLLQWPGKRHLKGGL
jgi:hypothetical protein